MIYLVYFLSGAAGLIYQVLWTRWLLVLVGSATLSVGAVLAAFMSGLAIGGGVGGRLAGRFSRPLIFYVLLETGIIVYALLFPLLYRLAGFSFGFLTGLTGPAGGSLILVRFLAAYLLLLVPTTLMGASWPAIGAHVLARRGGLVRSVGRLYGANTGGAALGAICATFMLIPAVGLQATLVLAAAVTGAAVLLALQQLAVGAAPGPTVGEETSLEEAGPSQDRVVRLFALGAIFLVGFVVMALEVLWARSLAQHAGSTTYASGSMLAAVLIGLTAGSFAVARFRGGRFRPSLWFVVLLGLLPGCAFLSILGFGLLPAVYIRLFPLFDFAWPWVSAVILASAIVLLFPPAFLSGALFPLANRIWIGTGREAGMGLGVVYLANTVGALLGALAAGLVLIPALGVRPGAALLGGIILLTALVGLILTADSRRSGRLLAAGAGAAVMVVSLLPVRPLLQPVPPERGVGWFYDIRTEAEREETDREGRRPLFYREGRDATVAVMEGAGGVRTLYVNSKPVASTAYYDMRLQRMLGHLPVLLAGRADTALVIGLGSGVTSGALLTHPLSRVVCLEIASAVAEASACFQAANGDPLHDPRFRLIVDDGLSYVADCRIKFDLITSDPIHPFVSGAGNLYSEDHFRRCRELLVPGGIMAQWLPLGDLSPEGARSIVRTFLAVFPGASLWFTNRDLVLVGARDGGGFSWPRIVERMGDPAVKRSLAEVRLDDPFTLAAAYLTGGQGLVRAGGDGPLITLNRPRIEFLAPKYIYAPVDYRNLQLFSEVRRSILPELFGYSDRDNERLGGVFRAGEHMIDGFLAEMRGDHDGRYRSLGRALEIFPGDRNLKSVLARYHYGSKGAESLVSGDYRGAIESYRAAVGLDGEIGALRRGLGLAYVGIDQSDSAATQFELLARLEPDNSESYLLLGNLMFQLDSLPRAEATYAKAIALDPKSVAPRFNLGLLYESSGRFDPAEAAFRDIIDKSPEFAPARIHLAGIELRRGRPGDSLETIDPLLAEHPSDIRALRIEALALEALGRNDEARRAWRRLLDTAPATERSRDWSPADGDEAGEAREHLGPSSTDP